ncbi:hypothetical protein CPT03_07100 [Pedobacter ginsengisoli]|uniref:Uncharacterized protein n=1 Tax=Pedobacter ginsengisoli TaxID=363852 RepID=A0A2D1U3S2_9SPHI|nr:hypothetical protein [Pedobacter ginsengisoli]ATP56252.1 hypothetical protein CPT03_07100 [Pedobacter ginsengisoli]
MPELSSHTLFLLLQTAAELGAKQSLCKTGKLKPYLSKSQAFREFGRSNIEHWIELGLITPRKDGDHSAAWRIDRIEADTIRHAKEIIIYI